MRRAAGCLWLLWSLAAAAVVPAQAQDTIAELIGLPVSGVRFEIEGRPDLSPELTAVSDVQSGRPLRLEDVRATVAHLDSLGRYDDIVPVATRTAAGVEIVFRLLPRHPISRLLIAPDKGPAVATLRERLLQRYGGVPANAKPAEVAAAARQLLEDDGYVDAMVQPEVQLVHDPEGALVTLRVAAGMLARIDTSEVVVRGGPVPVEEVRRRTAAIPGQPYRRRQLDAALTQVEDDLRARGYYEAQATLQASPSAGGYALRVIVDTGPHVELRVSPVAALPGDMDELIPIKRLGSADQDLLEDSSARIERALKAQGYWKAQAIFTRTVQPNGDLLISFAITRGPRYYVDRVEWPATLSVPPATLAELVAVSAGDVFDESRFLNGLARVADRYRRDGFYQVKIEPSYEEVESRRTPARTYVVLHPEITEGPRGVLAGVEIRFSGDHQVPESDLRQVMRSRAGQPYVETDAVQDRQALRTLYLNRGFRSADVAVEPVVGETGRDVTLVVRVNEGPQIVIGDIVIVGSEHVSEATIRETLGLERGQPAGAAAIAQARERLARLGVFRRVDISASELVGGEHETHLIVSVVESSDTTIGFGGGLEAGRSPRTSADGVQQDHLALSPRAFFEIGRQNLWGRARSINLFTRVSPKQRLAADDVSSDGGGFGFTEYRTTATYRGRRAVGPGYESTFVISGTAEQAQRTTFSFARKALSAEYYRQLRGSLSFSGRYSLDFTKLLQDRIPFNDRPTIDRLFPQVRLSALSTGVAWDRRDSLIAPSRGRMASGELELAARAFGSETSYLKSFFQGLQFVPLDRSSDASRPVRTVLALRAELGAAYSFLPEEEVRDDEGQPVFDEQGNIVRRKPVLPARERFYAGGSTTVRGFQQDRLGVSEILTDTGLSLGGNAVVVLNAEVRRSLTTFLGRGMSGVVFLDAGNVFNGPSDLRLTRIRSAAGFGIRYDSPLGPIRLDLGFKLRKDTINGKLDGEPERRWEYHLSIGEAF